MFPTTTLDQICFYDTIFPIVVACVVIIIAYFYTSTPNTPPKKPNSQPTQPPASEKATQPRYFTREELKQYNGENEQPIYIALKGKIYDVSSKAEFYGPGGGYHLFAGKDATRALAKMSFEKEDIENDDYSDLSFMERETLNDWVDKFEIYNAYTIVGRVIKKRDINLDEVAQFDGTDGKPIYVVLKNTIYDVTIKGAEWYGEKGNYHALAGKDATRALACMSLDEEMLTNPSVEGLTEAQEKVLDDWVKKFEKYAVIGKVIAASSKKRDETISS